MRVTAFHDSSRPKVLRTYMGKHTHNQAQITRDDTSQNAGADGG
jgi:hypothetical protein